MTRRIVLASLSAAALALAASVQTPAAAQACECARSFDHTVAYVARNYSGYADKVTPATRPRLDSLTAALRVRAAAAGTTPECHAVLREWVAFFRDGHLGVAMAPPQGQGGGERVDTAAVRARFAGWERRDLDEAAARRALDARGGALDPVEGIWTAVGSPYRLAVVREGEGFVATVLQADGVWWTPGQVKARFTTTGPGAYASRFWLRDHSEVAYTAHVARNVMRFSSGSYWVREHPAGGDALSAESLAAATSRDFAVRRLDERTAVLTLPSFDLSFAARVDSLLKANAELLRTTPDLIVDVRGNGGGADFTYRPVLPLLYTGPIVSVGPAMWATPDNTAKEAALLESPGLPADAREYLARRVAWMRAAPGTMVPEPDDTLRLDRVLPMPRRVAVLMDRGCGSSCEQFVLAARQSARVTLYGDRTAGVLDYANVRDEPLPCAGLVLRYATSRTRRLPHDPVDPHGIAPRVAVPESEVFPLEWVRAHLRGAPGGSR